MADSYVEINLTRLSNNVKAILEKYPEYKSYIGVVKGDAYGHGMRAVKALHNGGLRYFAVSSLEEAADLLFGNLVDICNGKLTTAEVLGDTEIAVTRIGYTV